MNKPIVIRRRALGALILAFLLVTAAFAPVAYRMGRVQGAALAGDLSQIGTSGPEVPFSGETTTDCTLLGPASSIHARNVIVDCLEGDRGEGGGVIAQRRPRETKTIFDIPIRPRETLLDNAVMAAVAGQGSGPGSGAGGNPLHLAMAPDGSSLPAGSIFDGATGWPGGGGGGGGSGIPMRLIPGGSGDTPPDPSGSEDPFGTPRPNGPPDNAPPGDDNTPPTNDNPEDEPPPPFEIPDGTPDPIDPPDLVTPVPGALPLMATGLLGFLFARRRKSTS